MRHCARVSSISRDAVRKNCWHLYRLSFRPLLAHSWFRHSREDDASSGFNSLKLRRSHLQLLRVADEIRKYSLEAIIAHCRSTHLRWCRLRMNACHTRPRCRCRARLSPAYGSEDDVLRPCAPLKAPQLHAEFTAARVRATTCASAAVAY